MIGSYTDEVIAAKAYDQAAYGFLGDKARLNFPELPDMEQDFSGHQVFGRREARAESARYVGVSKEEDGTYAARITNGRNLLFLGFFKTNEEAARRYDEAASQVYGAKAVLNFPPSRPRWTRWPDR